jgi:O-antigen ligase
MVHLAVYILYFLLMAVVLSRPARSIYLLAFLAAFYEHFTEFFIPAKLFGYPFLLKPFLIILILFILFSVIRLIVLRENIAMEREHVVALFAFFVFCLLSFFFAQKQKSIKMTELNLLLSATLLFFLPYFYRGRYVSLTKVILLFSLAASLVSTFHIFHFNFPDRRILFSWKEQLFPTFLTMVFPFISWGVICSKDKIKVALFLFAFFLVCLSGFISGIRGIYIALLCTYPFFLLSVWKYASEKRKVFLRIILLVSVIILTSVLAYHSSTQFRYKTEGTIYNLMTSSPDLTNADIHTSEISDSHIRGAYLTLSHYRTIPWRVACRMIVNSPLRGYGLNFTVIPGYGLHNSYLMVLISSGLIGFLMFLLGLACLFLIIRKKIIAQAEWPKKAFFLAVSLSLCSWLIMGLLQSTINDYVIWFIASLGMLRGEDLIA